MSLAIHSSLSAERYTPWDIVSAAHESMGGIDLDPASSTKANATVKAKNYFTIDHNGLDQEWHGRVFLNPPGTRAGLIFEGIRHHEPAVWWAKLCTEISFGRCTAAIFVVFNLETLRHLSKYDLPHPTEQSHVWLHERPCYLDGDKETPEVMGQPAHSSLIVLMGDVAREPWKKLGKVVR